MKKLIATLTICAILSSAQAALAATPTPTPGPSATPTPVPFITPTSQYQGLRPTPSAIFIPVSTPMISLSSHTGEIADSLINGYRLANLGSFFDIFLFVILAGLVIMIILDIADSAGGSA